MIKSHAIITHDNENSIIQKSLFGELDGPYAMHGNSVDD